MTTITARQKKPLLLDDMLRLLLHGKLNRPLDSLLVDKAEDREADKENRRKLFVLPASLLGSEKAATVVNSAMKTLITWQH